MVCTGLRLTGAERSRDITAALSMIRRDPEADLGRLGLIGWSHGAWTIMEWLHHPRLMQITREAGADIAALSFIYPYCGFASVIHRRDWLATAPVLIVTAERDGVVSNKPTERLARQLKARGIRVTFVTMQGARHAFDLSYKNCYDPERTADLEVSARDFLNRELASSSREAHKQKNVLTSRLEGDGN
jgi:dienelactone hydrolase